ncbi:MAG: sugar phosphate isomerase/epimerase [Rhodospirillales bacterium]|nr:sugar phosphate isomerase/epimerase [Rhodospirillales bacterium]
MSDAMARFAVNTYAYIYDGGAAGRMRRLADQGYGAVELMLSPGHLWPAELDAAARRELRALGASRLPIVTLNMPNLDINIAAGAQEMRDYSLGLLIQSVRCAGEIGAGGLILGPGKPNPLFPMPHARMLDHFHRALDVLAPVARAAGTRLLVENIPFGFLPGAAELMAAIDAHGDPDIRVIYDLANAHFIAEDTAAGLRRVRQRLSLVHVSDTTRTRYRHDPLGQGDLALEGLAAVLAEVGYRDRIMLEVISATPDQDIADSARRLAAAGLG